MERTEAPFPKRERGTPNTKCAESESGGDGPKLVIATVTWTVTASIHSHPFALHGIQHCIRNAQHTIVANEHKRSTRSPEGR